tara:strand:- start:286 stop:549 length:264 start_codon:yes stop_codon:yes gene_type:complete
MTLNEMLNKKLKNEMSLISKWKVDEDGLVFLNFRYYDEKAEKWAGMENLEIVKNILDNSLIFDVEELGKTLMVDFDSLYKQLYLEAK